MHFGRILSSSIYPPWKDKYIDYDKIKKLLKEGSSTPDSPVEAEEEWTEEDEEAFVEELMNVQLEKVAAFQAETLQRLRDETAECEKKLQPLGAGQQAASGNAPEVSVEDTDGSKAPVSDDEKKKVLNEVLKKLDSIAKETNELEKYSRINYSGFRKAAKKHDRRRGQAYRVRPLLEVRLSQLPFYKEDYSPLLYRLSAMYSFVRQSLDGKDHQGMSFTDNETGAESYMSYKFWVHPENLMELKTLILRHLPVLVYNPRTSKIADGTEPDPAVTSIYFDNPKFALYTMKVGHEPDAPSLRLRWYGPLEEESDIFFEKKIIRENDVSEEERFVAHERHIQPVIAGDYHMERSIDRLKTIYGESSDRVSEFQGAVKDIQAFIKDDQLQPILRANYSRTAFEIPGDDRIRISLDTNLAFIREDAIDVDRPCRDPESWHRADIDSKHLTYPFTEIRKGEISRFPFAVLEVKVKGQKRYEWVDELMNSHLVKEAPRFSKFVHGVASLFEDYVNTFPFWLSQVETDIRRDPDQAFQEEQERKEQMKEEDFVVGSLFGKSPARLAFRGSLSSPAGSPASKALYKPGTSPKVTSAMTRVEKPDRKDDILEEDSLDEEDTHVHEEEHGFTTTRGLGKLFPSWSTSKFARAHRDGPERLPPGVQKPTYWIKDQGEVKVEPKVWLANQRTFVKWQHISILLATLSLGLFNAAGADNYIGRALGAVYTLIAVFTGFWGWGIYMHRSALIRKRSPKDFDAKVGPVIICVSLMVALIMNFAFKVRFRLYRETQLTRVVPRRTRQ